MKHGIGGIADAFSSAKQTGRATLIPYTYAADMIVLQRQLAFS